MTKLHVEVPLSLGTYNQCLLKERCLEASTILSHPLFTPLMKLSHGQCC